MFHWDEGMKSSRLFAHKSTHSHGNHIYSDICSTKRHFSVYSLSNMTSKPIIPSNTLFAQGCSLSKMVTYPTNGMYPTTLPITSFSLSR